MGLVTHKAGNKLKTTESLLQVNLVCLMQSLSDMSVASDLSEWAGIYLTSALHLQCLRGYFPPPPTSSLILCLLTTGRRTKDGAWLKVLMHSDQPILFELIIENTKFIELNKNKARGHSFTNVNHAFLSALISISKSSQLCCLIIYFTTVIFLLMLFFP